MHQPPLPSVCLPFHKQYLLLQQPTSFPRSLPHTPSLTSNNISSLKISLLFLILSLLFQFTIISQFNCKQYLLHKKKIRILNWMGKTIPIKLIAFFVVFLIVQSDTAKTISWILQLLWITQ